ncbi:hypothetical protein Lalb_Chr06g0171171 [Lupinus albus]|uniref:Uncharacterized protein n=1 Tax=Lupinus albus TaxID=3870 RepID=A0A6A4QE96_LUPAL|nr:hypothetical protein Lalb_Chr06g0171171 [Lupinus albus]
MISIGLSKFRIKNSFGISISTYPSIGSDNFPSTVFNIQYENSMISIALELFCKHMFFGRVNIV